VAASVSARSRPLRRSGTNRRIGGVCGGLAEHFNVDATPIRLLWVIPSVFPGAVVGGAAVYAFAWLVIPSRAGSETQPVANAA
jgi:phage shock protein PspC (stress-responsive transcriptional regulator)